MQTAEPRFAPSLYETAERDRILNLYEDLDRELCGERRARITAHSTLDFPLPDFGSMLIATPPSKPSVFGALASRLPILVLVRVVKGEFLWRDLRCEQAKDPGERRARDLIAANANWNWFSISVPAAATTARCLARAGLVPVRKMLECQPPTPYLRRAIERGLLTFAIRQIDEINAEWWRRAGGSLLLVDARGCRPSEDRAAALLYLAEYCGLIFVASRNVPDEDLNHTARLANCFQRPNVVLICEPATDLLWVSALWDSPPMLKYAIGAPDGATIQ